MRKKLSILLAVVMVITSLTACGGSGASGETVYYIEDVSFSNPNYTGEMSAAEPLAEDDVRLVNAHSYEEIAPYVYEYTVTMDNWQEYFSVEIEYDNDKNYVVKLKLKEGYGVKSDFEINFAYNRVEFRDGAQVGNSSDTATTSVYAGYSEFNIATTFGCNTSNYFEAHNVVCTNIPENVVVYKLSLPSSMWVEHDGKTAFYVFGEEDGWLHEYENDSFDIAHLLGKDVIHQYASVFGTGEIETPVVDATPETSETTPEPPAEITFEGTYWLCYSLYGEDMIGGIYLDGNGKYISISYGEINEYVYSNLTATPVSDGTLYWFEVRGVNGENYGANAYVLGYDGNVYYEWGDGWSGGRDTYEKVSEDEFYGN